MPTQKDLMALNDAVMLSQCMRKGRADHSQQYFGAIKSREDRAERLYVRKARRAEMLRRLDAALVGACVVALAVLAYTIK